MDLQDQIIVCKDCGKEFTFTASEQAFYKERGFDNKPGRCPECRARFKAQRQGGGGGNFRGGDRGPRQMFTVTCAECGKETEVPFEPKDGRPVYCRECFDKRRAEQQGGDQSNNV